MACGSRCRRRLGIGFSSKDDELIFVRDQQPKVILATLLWQVATLCTHLAAFVTLLVNEAALAGEPVDAPAVHVKTAFLSFHLSAIGLEATVCLICARGARCGAACAGGWEMVSLLSAAGLCALLPWLSPWHFALLCGRHPDDLWASPVQDSEALVFLWLDALVAWYCLCVPVRGCRLWALPVSSWASVALLALSVGSPCPACVPFKMVALGLVFLFASASARLQEQRAREKWLASRPAEGAPLLLAVAHGMQEMVQAMCDLVVTLTGNFAIVHVDEVHENFFGRPLKGLAFTDLMPVEDRERFRTVISSMSVELPECIQTTLLLQEGPSAASLLAVNTGHPGACYIVSLSLTKDAVQSPTMQAVQRRARSQEQLGSRPSGGIELPGFAEEVGRQRSLGSPSQRDRAGGAWQAAQQRGQVSTRSMELPGFISEGDDVLGEVSHTLTADAWDRTLSSIPSNQKRDTQQHVSSRSAGRLGTASSLAYSEFSEVSCFLPSRAGPVLSGDLPPLPPGLRNRRPSAERNPLPPKEVGVQTEPQAVGQECSVNTLVSWEEVAFVCARCGRPPKIPGSPGRPSAGPRGGSRGSAPPKPLGRPSSGGRGGSSSEKEATSTDFDGTWAIWDDHSGFVSDWLMRVRIRGTRFIDALGKKGKLTFIDGRTYLEGGLLTLQDGVLYRSGKSGKALAFVREERNADEQPSQQDDERSDCTSVCSAATFLDLSSA